MSTYARNVGERHSERLSRHLPGCSRVIVAVIIIFLIFNKQETLVGQNLQK